MTISEYLQKQTRKINTARRVGILLLVPLGVALALWHVPRDAMIAILLASFAPAAVVMFAIGRGLKCPQCHAVLTPYLLPSRGNVLLPACPKCHADFGVPAPP